MPEPDRSTLDGAGVRSKRLSCRDACDRQTTHISSLARVLDRNGADVSRPIKIQDGVLTQILRFGDVAVAKPNVQGISVLGILEFYPLNPRSKNALCTLSRPLSSIARR